MLQVLSRKISITVAYIGNSWSHRFFTTDTHYTFGNTGVNIHKRIHHYCGAIWWQNSNSIKSYPSLQVGTKEVNLILKKYVCLFMTRNKSSGWYMKHSCSTCITYKLSFVFSSEICRHLMFVDFSYQYYVWHCLLSGVHITFQLTNSLVSWCLFCIMLTCFYYFWLDRPVGIDPETLGIVGQYTNYCTTCFPHFIHITFWQFAFRWLGVIILTFIYLVISIVP